MITLSGPQTQVLKLKSRCLVKKKIKTKHWLCPSFEIPWPLQTCLETLWKEGLGLFPDRTSHPFTSLLLSFVSVWSIINFPLREHNKQGVPLLVFSQSTTSSGESGFMRVTTKITILYPRALLWWHTQPRTVYRRLSKSHEAEALGLRAADAKANALAKASEDASVNVERDPIP